MTTPVLSSLDGVLSCYNDILIVITNNTLILTVVYAYAMTLTLTYNVRNNTRIFVDNTIYVIDSYA